MLVLSRHVDESIMIGEDVYIKILSIKSGIVKVGISAPSEIPVHRLEVYHRIQHDKGKDINGNIF